MSETLEAKALDASLAYDAIAESISDDFVAKALEASEA